MKAPLLLALLATACYAKKADHSGPVSGTGLPSPDGAPADAAPDAGPPPDGESASQSLDLAADRAPSPRITAYQQYLDDAWKAWSTRWAACFGTAPEALSPGQSPLSDDSPDRHAYSLEHGLVALDDASIKKCLEALQAIPCEGLATESYRDACADVLAGKVASGGFCASDEDCQAPADTCQMAAASGCRSHCAPAPARAAVDESCADRTCADGAFCAVAAAPATDARCRPLAAEGASCPDRLACQKGAFCQPTDPAGDAGTCRKVGAGLACLGSWQCPPAYACLFPAGGTAGTCQPGRKKGEPCTFHGKTAPGGPYHDCANGLFCYPDASNQLTCGPGHALNETCADADVGAVMPVSVPCLAGSCRVGSTGKPTCLPDQKAGEPCSAELPCASDLVCTAGRCVDPVVKVGAGCTSEGNLRCPEGARCAFPAPGIGVGTCVVIKKVGESCSDPDDCELGASCVNGVCAACK